MGLGSAGALPAELQSWDTRQTYSLDTLTATAMAERPDLRASRASRGVGEAALAAARREALPDISLGAGDPNHRLLGDGFTLGTHIGNVLVGFGGPRRCWH